MTQNAAAELVALIVRWQTLLRDQQRLSPNTLNAYQRDLAQFTKFLAGHFERPAQLSDFADLDAALAAVVLVVLVALGLAVFAMTAIGPGAARFSDIKRLLDRSSG